MRKVKGRLVYKKHDIKLFQELIKLHEEGGTMLQNCVAKVVQQSQLSDPNPLGIAGKLN